MEIKTCLIARVHLFIQQIFTWHFLCGMWQVAVIFFLFLILSSSTLIIISVWPWHNSKWIISSQDLARSLWKWQAVCVHSADFCERKYALASQGKEGAVRLHGDWREEKSQQQQQQWAHLRGGPERTACGANNQAAGEVDDGLFFPPDFPGCHPSKSRALAIDQKTFRILFRKSI